MAEEKGKPTPRSSGKRELVAVPLRAAIGDVFLAVKLDPQDVQALENAGVVVKREDTEAKPAPKSSAKHGLAFLGPVFAGLPEAAVLVGAATLGIVGGAAGAVGGKVANWMWPDKQAGKDG